MNFIKSRLTKDNFWNLMFLVGMIVGWSVALNFGQQNPMGASISSWLTLLGIPYIVAKKAKITFSKDDGFFNCTGESLKNRYPKALGRVFVVSIALVALTGFMLDSYGRSLSNLFTTTLLLSVLFLVPTLYFIYKNCPISILFNKNAWCEEVTGLKPGTYTPPSHSSSLSNSSSPSSLKSFMSQNPITDTSYSGWSGNIHSSSHLNRR